MEYSISVVYLIYAPYGTELCRKFFESYIEHDAGVKHELVVVFNGFDDEHELNPFYEIINSLKIRCKILLSKEKFDISSYFFAAENLDSDYILFLNSYSVILADSWLKFYYLAIQQPNVGVVGATGSGWQSSFDHFKQEFTESFFSSGENLKAAVSKWLHFRKFEGPCLRTNAFFVKKKVFSMLKYYDLHFKSFVPNFRKDSKLKTLYFEHGNKNLTYQIQKLGLKPVIVDKHGAVYDAPDWIKSRTLWIAEQENLLIQDNQTLKYENGDELLRKKMMYWAWGIDGSAEKKD